MSQGVNRVILYGNLGRDPELRYTPSGAAVANFSLATSENFKDAEGQRQERTEWHRIVVWGKTAELCGQYLKKGRQAYLEGKIQSRQYDDKDGQKRYISEVVANHVQFMGAKDDGNGAQGREHGDMGYDLPRQDAAPSRQPEQQAMSGMDGGQSQGAYPAPPAQRGGGGGSKRSYGGGHDAGYDDADDVPFHHEPRRMGNRT